MDAETIKIQQTEVDNLVSNLRMYRESNQKELKRVKQVMSVPNTQYGRDIIDKMKLHLSKTKKIVLRSSNHKNGDSHLSINLQDALNIGVYIEEKKS